MIKPLVVDSKGNTKYNVVLLDPCPVARWQLWNFLMYQVKCYRILYLKEFSQRIFDILQEYLVRAV